MKWVLCFLNPNDYVSFRTDLSDNNEYVYYIKFLQFILPHVKKDNKGFLENLNRHYTLYIDLENHSWEIYKKEYRKPAFDELLKLNEERELKKEQEKKYKNFGEIGVYKNTMNKVFDRKHEYDRFTTKDRSGTRESISAFFDKYRRRTGHQ